MADRMRLAADERQDLADPLETLTEDQWAQPSLCEGWTVRNVVAHVISYEEIGYIGLLGPLVRSGFRPSRLNAVRLAAYRDHDPAQLVDLLRSHLTPHGLTAGFGGGIGPRNAPAFPNRADIENDLRRFAVDEKRCCEFWGFVVDAHAEGLTLRWDGPPDAEDRIGRLLAYFVGDEPLTSISGLL